MKWLRRHQPATQAPAPPLTPPLVPPHVTVFLVRHGEVLTLVDTSSLVAESSAGLVHVASLLRQRLDQQFVIWHSPRTRTAVTADFLIQQLLEPPSQLSLADKPMGKPELDATIHRDPLGGLADALQAEGSVATSAHPRGIIMVTHDRVIADALHAHGHTGGYPELGFGATLQVMRPDNRLQSLYSGLPPRSR